MGSPYRLCCLLLAACPTFAVTSPIPGRATALSIGADGTLYVVGTGPCDGLGCAPYRWNGTRWDQVAGRATRIAADPDGVLWQVDAAGTIRSYSSRDAASSTEIPGRATDIAIGADGSVAVVGTAPCDANGCATYRRTGDSWQSIDGAAGRIAVDSSGTLWRIDRAGNIFRYRGPGSQVADQLAGSATAISASPDGDVYVVASALCEPGGCAVHKFDGVSFKPISGLFGVEIAADRGGVLWVLDSAGNILRHTSDQVPGQATAIAHGANGSFYTIGVGPCNANGCAPFRWTGTSTMQLAGRGRRIAVDPAGVPWLVDSTGSIFRYRSNATDQSDVVPGRATDISIGANGSLYVVGTFPCDNAGCAPYRRAGDTFQSVAGRAVRVAADPAGVLWRLDRNGDIFRHRAPDSDIADRIPGSATAISISPQGTVYVVGTGPCDLNGCAVYRYTGSGWTAVKGAMGVDIAAGNNGVLWTLTASGNIFRYDTLSIADPVPNAGSGTAHTFTFSFSTVTGVADLGVANILIRDVLDSRNACYLAYVPSAALLVLVNDAGEAGGPFAGSLVFPSAATISNSQCTVHGAGSSVSSSGNTLTLNLDLSFSPAFHGRHLVHLASRDLLGNTTGWQPLGLWHIPRSLPADPAIEAASPARSLSRSLNISTTFSDLHGAADLSVLNILINSNLDTRNACYLAFVPSNGTLLLVNDAGDAAGPHAGVSSIPAGSTIANRQCSIDPSRSSVVSSGNTLTLNLRFLFSAAFAGHRIVYAAARDSAGNNSGWQPIAIATVP
jgi:hypothetical protein